MFKSSLNLNFPPHKFEHNPPKSFLPNEDLSNMTSYRSLSIPTTTPKCPKY